MQERNLELEFRIKHYNQLRHRPKTAPARPRVNASSTPISTFNDSVSQATRHERQTKSQLPPPRKPILTSSATAENIVGPAFKPRYSNTRCSQEILSATSVSPSQKVTLHIPTVSHPEPHIQAALATRNHHQCRYQSHLQPGHVQHISSATLGPAELSSIRTQHSLISLAEAQRRAKPLPPLGPMSPSILEGVVEIGDSRSESRGDEVIEKRKRGLSGLFSRRKKEE